MSAWILPQAVAVAGLAVAAGVGEGLAPARRPPSRSGAVMVAARPRPQRWIVRLKAPMQPPPTLTDCQSRAGGQDGGSPLGWPGGPIEPPASGSVAVVGRSAASRSTCA